MIRNIFKSIEVLIDMYYHRKKLRFRYKRIKRYQRKGEIANIKVQEIKNQELFKDHTVDDNDYRNLESVIEEVLNSILEGIKVNVSKIYSEPIRVEISYKDCTEWFELSDYILKEGLFNGVLTKAKKVAYRLSIMQQKYELNKMQQEYEISERIRLNRLEDEVKRLIREVYPDIEVELHKDSTGKCYWLLLKYYGMSSTEYVMRNSSKQMYLDLASDFIKKVNREIQRKQQEKDKKKALFKKNNPLNLKAGETYRAKYKFSANWESVYIERITTDGFPWRRREMCSGIFDAENYDVKTHDGKWIHNRKAWEEFQAKKNRKKYIAKVVSNTLESKPQFLWDYRTYNHNGIKLQTIIH